MQTGKWKLTSAVFLFFSSALFFTLAFTVRFILFRNLRLNVQD